jgi:hypothetical protein
MTTKQAAVESRPPITMQVRDREIFGLWFRDVNSWAWFVFLAVVFGLPIWAEELEGVSEAHGRSKPALFGICARGAMPGLCPPYFRGCRWGPRDIG